MLTFAHLFISVPVLDDRFYDPNYPGYFVGVNPGAYTIANVPIDPSAFSEANGEIIGYAVLVVQAGGKGIKMCLILPFKRYALPCNINSTGRSVWFQAVVILKSTRNHLQPDRTAGQPVVGFEAAPKQPMEETH